MYGCTLRKPKPQRKKVKASFERQPRQPDAGNRRDGDQAYGKARRQRLRGQDQDRERKAAVGQAGQASACEERSTEGKTMTEYRDDLQTDGEEETTA